MAELPPLLDGGPLDLRRAVVLCDIEGAEFDLFTDALLERLASAFVVIESHDFDRAGGFPRATALAARA
ncbi:hypothetical protein, partial [Klebsiella oxytoca]|uniref:hypothetical protein n=1 Tax=Klebsiella oxytoca TaxID=571 RepID=UPI0013AD49F9|nr:hypothetical protein [Klebsiella oxytoca]